MNVLVSIGWLIFALFCSYLLWAGRVDVSEDWHVVWGFILVIAFLFLGIYQSASLFDSVEFDRVCDQLRILKFAAFVKRYKEYSLGNIYRIQLIKIKTQKVGVLYELNLVMNDKERVSLVAHGRKNKIEEDAQVLSRVLNTGVCKNYE